MDYLYLLLNLGSISIPFIFSFHPKLKFYKHYKYLGVGILVSMLIFIPWDVFFTIHGIWGFNEQYFSGIKILHLPLEEWLFFICIPYACVFTHYALLYYFPKMKIPKVLAQRIGYLLVATCTAISLFNYDRWYTTINFLLGALLTSLVLIKNTSLLQTYFITFLVMLIPFFLVNGILTGSFIENEVVWYNDNENLGIRLFTIPVEDTIYAFSLILLNLFVIKLLEKKQPYNINKAV